MLPGEPIVLVATASAHRQAALDACAFLIDWLKTKAPFWKLEETGGDERWVEARASDDAGGGALGAPGAVTGRRQPSARLASTKSRKARTLAGGRWREGW